MDNNKKNEDVFPGFMKIRQMKLYHLVCMDNNRKMMLYSLCAWKITVKRSCFTLGLLTITDKWSCITLDVWTITKKWSCITLCVWKITNKWSCVPPGVSPIASLNSVRHKILSSFIIDSYDKVRGRNKAQWWLLSVHYRFSIWNIVQQDTIS
jgi:hypothetical protein